jgi:LDH2 family malate/lactate/ureidoglycolate dehydrogenase
MGSKIHYIPVDKLRAFIEDVYKKAGVPSEDASTCAQVIIESDIRGIESHGIGRLKYYYLRIKSGQHQVITNFEVVKESPTTALVDGHHGMGMVIGKQAMSLAIRKAKEFGMGSVAVRNSTHFGIAGYYPTMAVDEGMIGFTVTNARPSTAPTFGVQPLLGTNPIAFGAPSDETFPFLYDGATPITQRGKIEVYAREGKTTPEGWVINQENQYLTNTQEILDLLPKGTAAFVPLGGKDELLGGHKGYGLSVMVEILSAALQQGAFLLDLSGIGENGEKVPFKVGHFFMAINIESFLPLEIFKKTTGDILRTLRSSRKAPGSAQIFTAGEKEFENRKRITREGIPVIPTLQEDIRYLQQELDLKEYEFGF